MSSEAAEECWTLRLRGPKGTPGEIVVAQGPKTTIKELRKLFAKAAKVAEKRLVIKHGFPPKEVVAEGLITVGEAGFRDKDLVHIERRTAQTNEAEASTSNKKAPSKPKNPAANESPVVLTPGKIRIDKDGNARPKVVRKRKLKMPGSGMRLGGKGDGDDGGGGTSNDAFSLGAPKSTMESAMDRIGAELAMAAPMGKKGKGGGDQMSASIVRSLRKSLREARRQRGAEAEAELKYAAAISGKVRFEAVRDGSGRVRAIYACSARKEREDCVSDIPGFLLKAVLKQIATDAERDPNSRQNLRPQNMALVSSRVFWAIVKHGEVGPGCSFPMALTKLVPDVNWYDMEQRVRNKPDRYQDYVGQK